MVLKMLLLISSLLILQAYGLTRKPVELPKCVGNEVLNKCFQDCFSQRCPTHDGPKPLCLPTKDCIPACVCPFNHRRNKQNVCIPTRECSPYKCKGKNQVYNPCPPLCPGEKCADRKLKKCPFNIKMILNCNPTCRCRPGFYRDANNNCISAAECGNLQQCPVNEIWNSCPNFCKLESCNSLIHKYACRPAYPPVCHPRCVCLDGYYRNKNNRCVPVSHCEKCVKNEVFACHSICTPKTCTSMVERRMCPSDNECKYKCDCKDGFLRNKDGICIVSTKCYPSTTDRNPANPDRVNPYSVDPDPADPDSANPDPADPDPADPDPADVDSVDPDPRNSDPGNWNPVDPNPANPDSDAPKIADPDPIPNQSQPNDDGDQCDDDDEN